MPPVPKKVPARFYRSLNGHEPVREWIKGLDEAEQKIIGQDIAVVEYTWPVGMPLSRSLGGGLWEVRSHLPSHRIARILFIIANGHMILLHGFIKKTQKTPSHELDMARRRMKESMP